MFIFTSMDCNGTTTTVMKIQTERCGNVGAGTDKGWGLGRGDVWVSLREFIGSSQAELGEEAGDHITWVALQVIQ